MVKTKLVVTQAQMKDKMKDMSHCEKIAYMEGYRDATISAQKIMKEVYHG